MYTPPAQEPRGERRRYAAPRTYANRNIAIRNDASNETRVTVMNETIYPTRDVLPVLDEGWSSWQTEVLQIIHAEFSGVLEAISWDDVDWSAWRPLFDQGYSACEAVRSAFGRVA
jgi:hypothetical protein